MSSRTPTEPGRAYVSRMMQRLDGRDPLDVMSELPNALVELVNGLSDAQLRASEAPGKWSIAEVVHHLADTELVYGYRLRMALTVTEPHFERFDQEAWVERFLHDDAPLDPALAQVSALRSAHLSLARRLGPEDAARGGVHTSRGLETVGRMLALWAAHDLVHRDQISRIKRAVVR